MKIEELVKFLEKEGVSQHEFNGYCEDCGRSVCVSVECQGNNIIIGGGAVHRYLNNLSMNYETQYKCDACFEKDKKFHPRCDKYSRIVGYLTPVS